MATGTRGAASLKNWIFSDVASGTQVNTVNIPEDSVLQWRCAMPTGKNAAISLENWIFTDVASGTQVNTVNVPEDSVLQWCCAVSTGKNAAISLENWIFRDDRSCRQVNTAPHPWSQDLRQRLFKNLKARTSLMTQWHMWQPATPNSWWLVNA
jgi:hypothetical protein